MKGSHVMYYGRYNDNLNILLLSKQIAQTPQNLLLAKVKYALLCNFHLTSSRNLISYEPLVIHLVKASTP